GDALGRAATAKAHQPLFADELERPERIDALGQRARRGDAALERLVEDAGAHGVLRFADHVGLAMGERLDEDAAGADDDAVVADGDGAERPVAHDLQRDALFALGQRGQQQARGERAADGNGSGGGELVPARALGDELGGDGGDYTDVALAIDGAHQAVFG